MGKLYATLLSNRMNGKFSCNFCDKKYGGKKGIKLHFKYSHGINLKDEDLSESETFYRCRTCTENAINCKCYVARQIK